MITNWLLLLYALPAGHSSRRVGLWRTLKKVGAVSLKTSASVLPDTPTHYERFQWLAKQIRDERGEAVVIRTAEIEGMSPRQIHAMFNGARAADYTELMGELTALLRANARKGRALVPALERLRSRMAEIQRIDFFACPRAQDALMLLNKAERLGSPRPHSRPVARVNLAAFRNKTWLTRPRPEIDRVASAWLIKRFIDPRARFVFASKPEAHPAAIPYDMIDVEFTHHGDDCTFETLLKRFALPDRTLRRLGEMVHEADLNDGKFNAIEAIGLDRMLKGLGRLGRSDDEILQHGLISFDALYAQLKEA
jgi:hypothetical protein